MKICVAIPIYNEEEVLPALDERLQRLFQDNPQVQWEVLFVDDGSTDSSRSILDSLVQQHQNYKAIIFSRNFGHQSALDAAIKNCHADALVLMDGDLQDPPELIPTFIEHYKEGFDVVYAYRASREGSLILRSLYYAFYRMFNLIADFQIPVDSGDFALFSKRVVDELAQLPENDKFLRGLRAWVGFRQKGVALDRPKRELGTSKYSFVKLVQLSCNAIFSFSNLPLRLAYLTGLASILFSVSFSLYSLYEKLFGGSVPSGFTAIIIMLSFVSGVQLLVLGIIGEYVGRIFEQIKNRPAYLIDEKLGFP